MFAVGIFDAIIQGKKGIKITPKKLGLECHMILMEEVINLYEMV